jgi:Putative zinc-finger
MLSCKDAAALVSESLDRRLPLGQRIALRMHLIFCRFCRRFSRQVLFLKEVAGRVKKGKAGEESPVSDSLSAEAKEKIEQALKTHSEAKSNP